MTISVLDRLKLGKELSDLMQAQKNCASIATRHHW